MAQASLIAQLVKNLPAIRETWVQSLGWEDPLEKGTATHSSILACKESDMTEHLTLHFIFPYSPELTSMHDCWKNHSFD